MLELVQQAEGVWAYVALFLLAAAPWLDVFVVVPLGIVAGLSPITVSIVGFAGNFLMIVLIGLFFKQFSLWRESRRVKRGLSGPSKKELRAKSIMERYGLPGLALLAPVLLGTDIAAVLAFSLGLSRTRVIQWMGISLVVWTIAMAIGSVYGFGYMAWI